MERIKRTPTQEFRSPSTHSNNSASSKNNSSKVLFTQQERYFKSRKFDNTPGLNLITSLCYDLPNKDPIYHAIKQSNPSVFASDSDFGHLSASPSRCSGSYRSLPTQCEKILDAPDIVDDYYLNLLSWSDSNVLSVALKNTLY